MNQLIQRQKLDHHSNVGYLFPFYNRKPQIPLKIVTTTTQSHWRWWQRYRSKREREREKMPLFELKFPKRTQATSTKTDCFNCKTKQEEYIKHKIKTTNKHDNKRKTVGFSNFYCKTKRPTYNTKPNHRINKMFFIHWLIYCLHKLCLICFAASFLRLLFHQLPVQPPKKQKTGADFETQNTFKHRIDSECDDTTKLSRRWWRQNWSVYGKKHRYVTSKYAALNSCSFE